MSSSGCVLGRAKTANPKPAQRLHPALQRARHRRDVGEHARLDVGRVRARAGSPAPSTNQAAMASNRGREAAVGRAPMTVDRVMSMFGASQMSRSRAGCGRGRRPRRRRPDRQGPGRACRPGQGRRGCRTREQSAAPAPAAGAVGGAGAGAVGGRRGGPAGAVARRPGRRPITRRGDRARRRPPARTGRRRRPAPRRTQPGISSAGIGCPSSQPWARSQPAARTIRRCSGVSTPSATERMPSVRVRPTIAARTAPVSPADGLLGGGEQRAVDLQRADRQREQLRQRGPARCRSRRSPRGRRSCAAR